MRKNPYYSLLLLRIFTCLSAKQDANTKPGLECFADRMRLRLIPTVNFKGHIYVKGYYFSRNCHSDFSRNAPTKEIDFDVPYYKNCNVKRQHTGRSGGLSYETTVIIQHHPLFVTAGDSAFHLKCVYVASETKVTQRISVSDLSTESVSIESRPSCEYHVLLNSVQGPPVMFANVGDVIVHKWNCNSDEHGFLVHSCVVRNEIGEEYELVNERGCATDTSLLPELQYSPDFSFASSSVPAFRFADQAVVHFACHITLCRKKEQGCEGISPPTCQPIPLPPIKTEYKAEKKEENAIFELSQTEELRNESFAEFEEEYIDDYGYEPNSNKHPTTNDRTSSHDKKNLVRTGSSKWLNGLENRKYGLEISAQKGERHNAHVPSTVEDDGSFDNTFLPSPSKAQIYYGRSRIRRKAGNENITVQVEAPELFVFTPTQKVSLTPATSQVNSESLQSENVTPPVLYGLLFALLIAASIVMTAQHMYYKREIKTLRLKLLG